MADMKETAFYPFAFLAGCTAIISCYALFVSLNEPPINITTIETNKSVNLANGILRHPKVINREKFQRTVPSRSKNPRILNFTNIGENDLIEKCEQDFQAYYIRLFVKLFICGILTSIPMLMLKIPYIKKMQTCYLLIFAVFVCIVLLIYDLLTINFRQRERMSIHDEWVCSEDIISVSIFVPHVALLNILIYGIVYFHCVFLLFSFGFTVIVFVRHLLCKRIGDVDPDDTLLPKTEGNYIMSLKNPSYVPV